MITCKTFLSSTDSFISHKKLFTCDHCFKQFFSVGDLKKHKRIHTEEKSFTCDNCFKQFFNVGDLKKRKRIHTGRK